MIALFVYVAFMSYCLYLNYSRTKVIPKKKTEKPKRVFYPVTDRIDDPYFIQFLK